MPWVNKISGNVMNSLKMLSLYLNENRKAVKKKKSFQKRVEEITCKKHRQE